MFFLFLSFLILSISCQGQPAWLWKNDMRIIGGFQMNRNDTSMQWVVSLQTEYGDSVCGGSLIGDRWVLTAAHCFEDVGKMNVVAGVVDLFDFRKRRQVRSVVNVIIHPQYNSKTKINDIAILELNTTIELKAYGVLVNDPMKQEKVGIRVGAAGWGTTFYNGIRSDYLRYVTMPIVGYKVCQKLYPNDQWFSAGFLCAGTSGKDTCQGDSGGPLYVDTNGTKYIVGITSWGENCGVKPGVYTRVSAYLPFIEEKTGIVKFSTMKPTVKPTMKPTVKPTKKKIIKTGKPTIN